MFSLTELESAADIVHSIMPATPAYRWPQLCNSTGTELWVKHENHTPTTAFKVRGGIYLLNKLSQSVDKPNGLISATRGNHGQSLSYSGSHACFFGNPWSGGGLETRKYDRLCFYTKHKKCQK